jgi:hypothetical protein
MGTVPSHVAPISRIADAPFVNSAEGAFSFSVSEMRGLEVSDGVSVDLLVA